MVNIEIESIIWANEKALGGGKAHVDESRLGSCLASYHYQPTDEFQIAAIVNNIIKFHPFVDGNKRTAFSLCVRDRGQQIL